MRIVYTIFKQLLILLSINAFVHASTENEVIKNLGYVKAAGGLYELLADVTLDELNKVETISNIARVNALKEYRTYSIINSEISYSQLDMLDETISSVENNLEISTANKFKKLEEKYLQNPIFEGTMNGLTLCIGTYSFVQNFALVFDSNGDVDDRQIAFIKGLVNAKDVYASVAGIAKISFKYFPKSKVAKFLATNSLSKGVLSLSKFKVANRLNVVVSGAQIIASLYKGSLSGTFKDINKNILSQYQAMLGMRKIILDELITLYKNKSVLYYESITETDIDAILAKAMVLNDGNDTYILRTMFAETINPESLNSKFGKTSFNDLTNKEKILLAINALSMLSIVEDSYMDSYINEMITNNVSFNAKLFSIFESSIYDIFDSTSLKDKLFGYYGTDMTAFTYYQYMYEGLFNSIDAEMQLIRQAEIGKRIEKIRYASMLKQDYENQLSRLLEVINPSLHDKIALYIAKDVDYIDEIVAATDLNRDYMITYKNDSTNGFVSTPARFDKTIGALVFDSPLSETYELYMVSIPRDGYTAYKTYMLPENNSGVFIENLTQNTQSDNEPVVVTTTSVKKTGQTISYTEYDDGFYQAGVNNSYTRDDTKQIVTDNITGLQWQDDEEAKTITKRWVTQANYDAGNYSDTSGDTATTYCEDSTLGGFTDWRLPTIKELQSIVDDSKYNPSINSIFKNISSSLYWSSTANAYSTRYVWYVYYSNGYSSNNYKLDTVYVRCVRAGQ